MASYAQGWSPLSIKTSLYKNLNLLIQKSFNIFTSVHHQNQHQVHIKILHYFNIQIKTNYMLLKMNEGADSFAVITHDLEKKKKI